VLAAPAAADLDRTAVDFTPPLEIKGVRNAAGTNEQAVLFGDPSKPGPYVVRIKCQDRRDDHPGVGHGPGDVDAGREALNQTTRQLLST
jgi:hypothetical protein